MATIQESIAELAAVQASEQPTAIRRAVAALFADQRESLEQAFGLDRPDQATSNKVWLMTIWAFASVMLLAVLVMGISLFVPVTSVGTKPETILTVFTTVTGFLAGLFVPSPVAKKAGG